MCVCVDVDVDVDVDVKDTCRGGDVWIGYSVHE